MTPVLLVGDYPPPMGGIAVHVRQLHDALVRRGARVRGIDLGRAAGVHPQVRRARPGPALLGALVEEKEAVTHLHTSGNNPRSLAVVAGVGLFRSGKGPSVVTLHSGLLPAFLAHSKARRIAARAALAPYARIIAVSEAVAAALHAAGVDGSRIRVHPAFVASEVRPAALDPALDSALTDRLAARRPLVAYAHHPSKVYGRALFLEALARVRARRPGLTAVIYGPGTDAPEFAADVRAAGVAGALEVVGELEHPVALGVMAACDLFVRPTLADGDAISVREALALGVRCVASDASARPSGVTCFETGSVSSLARAIDAALEAPAASDAGPDAADFLLQQYAQAWAGHRPGILHHERFLKGGTQ